MTSRTLRVLLAGALVVVLLLVALLGRLRDPEPVAESSATTTLSAMEPAADTSPDNVAPEPTPDEMHAPVRDDAIVMTGFTRDEVGARAAAVAYLEATEDVVAMTPSEAAEAQRSISTEASADRLASRVEQQLVDVIAQTPQGIQVWIAPMVARSIAVGDGFEVSIWYAEVIAIGTDSTFDNWRTVTYSLVWERDTWLIEDSVSIVGPVPSRSAGLTVTPPAALVSTLGLFDDGGLTP